MEKEAYQLLLEGKYQEAAELLKQVVDESPTESALFNYALALYRLDRHDEALEVLERLIDQNREHKKALFLKGIICRRMGDMECAREAFDMGGFEELRDLIPSPIERPKVEPEEEEDVVVLEEEHPEREEPKEEEAPAEEEQPSPSTQEVQKDSGGNLHVIRMNVKGTVFVPLDAFAAFIAIEGTVEERNGECVCSGDGEVILFTEPVEGEVMSDSGEGQLLIDEGEEKLIVKANPEERVFYKVCARINWQKL